jgi:hypothetical protein
VNISGNCEGFVASVKTKFLSFFILLLLSLCRLGISFQTPNPSPVFDEFLKKARSEYFFPLMESGTQLTQTMRAKILGYALRKYRAELGSTPDAAARLSEIRRQLQSLIEEVPSEQPLWPTIEAAEAGRYDGEMAELFPSPDIPSLQAKVTGFKFYEAGKNNIPQSERQYKRIFEKSPTRFVYWQLSIDYPDPGRRIDFQIRHIWYRPDGATPLEYDRDSHILTGYRSTDITSGKGWQEPGRWDPGTYRVELFAEGKMIAEGSFEITGGGVFPDPQDYDIPSIKAKVTSMRLFEGGREGVPRHDRVYSRTFARSSTRFVLWELNLEYPKPGIRKNFRIDAVWYRGDGSVYAEQVKDAYVEPDWSSSHHTIGRGWDNPGNWEPGSYRIVLSVDGREVAWQIFTIVDQYNDRSFLSRGK